MESIEERLFQIMDYLRPRHFALDVSLPHLAILRWLGRSGPISVSHTAQYAQVSQSAVTQAAKKLEQHGYVTRRRDEHDQRVVWISLTDAGREQVEAFKRMQRERLAILLSALPDEEKRHLAQILSHITLEAVPAGEGLQ